MRSARHGVVDRPVAEYYVRKLGRSTGETVWKPLTVHADPGNADCDLFVSHAHRIDCVSLRAGGYARTTLELSAASGAIAGCAVFSSPLDPPHSGRRLALALTLHPRDGVRLRALEVSSGGVHSNRVINTMDGGTVAMAGY